MGFENIKDIIKKGEEEGAEATDISGDPHAHETVERTFSFSKEEKQEMRERGMSDEEIEQKRQQAEARMNREQKAA